MSDCIMKFKLKQETQMIHFQYDEPGATLRASDVKPRLDKFLYDVYGSEMLAPFVKDKDHSALDYKMNFIAPYKKDEKVHEIPNKNIPKASFFGNIGKHEDLKKSIKYTEPIDGKIICFHTELMKMIMDSIVAFFFFNNFGTREDKGYGCYRLTMLQGKKINTSVNEIVKSYGDKLPTYVYEIDDNACSNKKDHLGNADMLYKLIKSGINASRKDGSCIAYRKSLLTKYFLSREKVIGGEKRWMKKNGIAPALGKSAREDVNDPVQNEDYRYIRALMGISDGQEWFRDEKRSDKVKINIKSADNSPVARFKSPITMVIYNDVLYLTAYEPSSIIFDQRFIFDGMKSMGINTPSSMEFSMSDFLQGVSIELDKKDSGDNKRIGDFKYFGGNSYSFRMKEVR